jgi:hypothetical protein
MSKQEIKFIFLAFLVWRLGLFGILFLAIKFVHLQPNFLGGGLGNYLSSPFFWAWSNFDGQHYTSIAQNGYGFGEYTFFPLYPLLIKFIGGILGGSLYALNLAGNLISNLSFLVALFGFWKLLRIDFSGKIARLSMVLLLLFPTSFYFATVYTESLFFALLAWSFYFARKSKFVPAGVLGLFMSAARPVGIFIFPALIVEWYLQNSKRKVSLNKFPLTTLFAPLGLISYMYYLKNQINDAFAFFDQQVLIGEHRSSHVILIPQILYRYVFKIFPNLNYTYFPGIFFTVLEFGAGIIYLILTIVMLFTTRLSYAVFAFLAYLTPTFLGSFSSMPRYVLIIFPFYFLVAQHAGKSRMQLFAFCLFSFILLVISFSLFARGYWIS